MITGAYIRIERDGRWMNVEINTLTDAELDQFAERQGPDRGWIWAKFLAKWIRDHVVDQPEEETAK